MTHENVPVTNFDREICERARVRMKDAPLELRDEDFSALAIVR